ncbi:MAG: phenylacetate--CoA ligase family protein [Thermoanaerobacteraceae bacterium]|nr:phenylacetate--CoA ligase family protein [Thermoanaerobacteraceae bacterium]
MTSKFEKRIKSATKPALLTKYFSGPDFPDEMPATKIAKFQEEALQELITRAYNNSPFYHQKMAAAGVKPQDIGSINDLARVPFTTKDELRGKPWALLACDKKDISIIHISTGTTGGEEIYIMQTWNDYYLNELAPGYPNLFPVESDDICFNALPYEMSSAGLSFHKVFMEGCQATTIPVGKGGAYSTPEKSIKILRDLQPTVVITTPSWAIRLAEAASEASFDLTTLPLKKIWLTGEGCSPAFRERVEKIWGTKANFYYGSLEAGGIGAECDAHNGYHIVQGHVITEIVDPDTGTVLEPGQIGEIVVTCLLRFDTPLIRYRTQDLGFIDPDPCQCGITFPRLFLRGRVVDEIVINGTNFSPFYLEEFLMRMPEVGNWYQFVVKPGNNDKLKVRVELAPGVQPTAELVDKLSSKLEFAVGIPCEFEIVDKLPRPREKTVRVVHEEE